MTDRSALLENAVRFLQDPQVRASSLAKQVAFLESKGLNREEIDEALQKAGVSSGAAGPAVAAAGHSLPPPLPVGPPPVRAIEDRFNWGKFALMLAVIGSAGAALSQSVFLVANGKLTETDCA